MAFHWLTLIGLSSISKWKSQKCRIFFSSTFTSNLCNAFTPYFTSPIGLKVFSRNAQWVKIISEGSLNFFLHIFLLFWLHNRRILNPTTYDIIHWFAGWLGQMTCQVWDVPSITFLYNLSKLF